MADTRIEELRRRLERDPGSRLFAQLAEELRKGGDLDEAVRVARSGLAVHPAYASARLTLGRALLDSGDAQAAKGELESVLREAPDNIQASRYLALVRDQLGELAGAAEQYRKTLLMAPGDRQLQAALAELETRRGAGALSGAGAETTPPVSRGVPPPLPPDAGLAGPTAARASAPPVVFAPSRPERPAEIETDETLEGGGLAPTLRIHASQPAAPAGPSREPAWAPAPPPPAPPPPAAPPLAAPPPPAAPEPASAPAALPPRPAAAAVQARPADAPEPTGGPEPGTLPGGRTDAASQAPDAGAPFPSSTLAELYFQQGLVDRAADVYRQLLEQEPGNEKARARLAEIEGAPAETSDRGARRRALERTIAGLESLLLAVRRR